MTARYGRLPLLCLLLGFLPLLFCQCAGKQNPLKMRQELQERDAALNAADIKWEKKQAKAAQKSLTPERLEALGELSLQSRDYETALVNFLEILKTHPERYEIRYKLGVVLFLTGQLDGARQELALVLVQHPEMLEAHEALGLVHLKEKKFAQAADEFQQVLQQDPKRTKARHLLGITYLEAGQTQRAITELQKAAAQDPGNLANHIALGQAYLKLNDYNRALSILKSAQSRAPDDPKLNRQIGMALAGMKRYPEALNAFLKAGDEAQAYNNIGVYYYKDGQYEEAAKCFQKALDLRPTFYSEAKANLQQALEKLQQSH